MLHLAFLIKKTDFDWILCKLSWIKISETPSVYAGFVDFCPIIPYSSILLTIPVAFIYEPNSLFTFVGDANPYINFKIVIVLSVN